MADPATSDLTKQITDTQTALNFVWTPVGGFLVSDSTPDRRSPRSSPPKSNVGLFARHRSPAGGAAPNSRVTWSACASKEDSANARYVASLDRCLGHGVRC
jgi:hypothetical protein